MGFDRLALSSSPFLSLPLPSSSFLFLPLASPPERLAWPLGGRGLTISSRASSAACKLSASTSNCPLFVIRCGDQCGRASSRVVGGSRVLAADLHCLALPCTALRCLALPCNALHCLALPCTALHCLAADSVSTKSRCLWSLVSGLWSLYSMALLYEIASSTLYTHSLHMPCYYSASCAAVPLCRCAAMYSSDSL